MLLTAVFNAVLRISQESTLTLFRLLIPVSLVLINNISNKAFGSLVKVSLVLIVIGSLQYLLVKELFYPNVQTISYTHLLNYCIHYISIFVVAALVYCLWKLENDLFFIRLINFSSRLIKFILIIYIPYVATGHEPASFLVFGNINDLGCILTGGILVILFDTITKRPYKYLYVVILLFLLYYNDSKLAMFGGVFQVGLYYIHQLSTRITNAKKIISAILISIGVFGIVSFFSSSIEINGYSVREMVTIPFEQISSGTYFPESSQSFTFRSNTIIGITEILRTTMGIGVGPGNTSLILKNLIPDPSSAIRQNYVSSHIWLYEIMADIGWLIIIPMICLYIRQWRRYSSMKSKEAELFSQIYILSFPIWSMSSSGLYTEFFSIMMISMSIIIYKNKCNKYSPIK